MPQGLRLQEARTNKDERRPPFRMSPVPSHTQRMSPEKESSDIGQPEMIQGRIGTHLQEAHAILNGGLGPLELPEDGSKNCSAIHIGGHT